MLVTWILIFIIWVLMITDYFQGKRIDLLSKRIDLLSGDDVGGAPK